MRYRAIIERGKEGVYVAECPVLPGCFSQGKTRAEALENINDAIAGHLESLRKHDEPIPPAVEKEQLQETEAERLPEIRCLDCGAELKPDDGCCPSCGSRNRAIAPYEQARMHAMIDLKQRANGYRKFKRRLKQGEKIAGESKRPAQEFDVYDKECNLRCHIVVEQDSNGEFELVHCHIGPLDPSKPVKARTAPLKVPYAVDHETEAHIILRHIDPPHRRLVIPKQKELCMSLLKALWRQAGLNVQEFGELLIWCLGKNG